MSVISIQFIFFLLLAVVLYYTAPPKWQWKILLIESFCFYVLCSARAILFFCVTAVSIWYAAIRMDRINAEYQKEIDAYAAQGKKLTRQEKLAMKKQEDRRKRKILIALLLLNFGILFFIKYGEIPCRIWNGVCAVLRLDWEADYSGILVPLGISYYTFQAVGYLIDIYRRKMRAERSLPRLALFLAFFPQLVQGPISRYHELAGQLFEPHPFRFQNIRNGAELMAWGLFKKLVISDRLAIMVNTVFGMPDQYDGCYLLFASVFSMLQLYTDFSGGIDMMRGAAEMFGMDLPENFVRPFFARDQSEYWRRWHISLNNWWRDYIFYPLTLSRAFQALGRKTRKWLGERFGKKLPVLLAVIIIRVINSIWHGATGASILGGLYYGILLALSFYFDYAIQKITQKLHIRTNCISWRIFQTLRTFLLIAAPRLISQARSLSDGGKVFSCLFQEWNPWIFFDGSLFSLGVSRAQFTVLLLALLLLFVVSLLQERGIRIRESLARQNLVFQGLILICFFYTVVLFGVYGSGYDASAFTYAQF